MLFRGVEILANGYDMAADGAGGSHDVTSPIVYFVHFDTHISLRRECFGIINALLDPFALRSNSTS